MRISVIIHTFNSEKFLKQVLESVKAFDEIIICDMYSSDRTLQIAEEYNCNIIFHENIGFVEPARNFAISHAKNDWVLIVDSDEVIPNALRLYIYDFIKNASSSVSALRIPRKNYILGKFDHSSYPDYICRLVRKNKVDWPAIVHRQPIIDGDIITLDKSRKDLAFIHLANESIYERFQKINKYSFYEIEKRENKKVTYLSLIFQPFFKFISVYFLKGAIRDGKAGLIKASQDAIYRFLILAKIIEKNTPKNKWDKELQ